MTIVIGQHILINKHVPHGSGRRSSRKYFTPEDFEAQRELARTYGEKSGEDYLICQVIEEIPAPAGSKSKRNIAYKEPNMVQPDSIGEGANNIVKAGSLHLGDTVHYGGAQRTIRSVSKNENTIRIIFEGIGKRLDITVSVDYDIVLISRRDDKK